MSKKLKYQKRVRRQANLLPLILGGVLWSNKKKKQVAAAQAEAAAAQEELSYAQGQLDALQAQQTTTSSGINSTLIMWVLIGLGVFLLFKK